MTPRLKNSIALYSKTVDKALKRYLSSNGSRPRIIYKAMQYSVFAGGKRLRPILVLIANQACGGNTKWAMPVACAMELIHTYSLIHDDLPAMDDDDLRRGRPTNHKVFGEDMAILAGDALLTEAFSLISKSDPRILSTLLNIITKGAGTNGMIGGQVADIQSDKGRWKKRKFEIKNPRHLLDFIHRKKTAALITASLQAGASLAGALPRGRRRKEFDAITRYGQYIGLAFQVQDDILDRIGNKKKLGKKGSDKANQKLTFPALYGLEKSKDMAKDLVIKAHKSLRPLAPRSKGTLLLHDLADYVLSRDH